MTREQEKQRSIDRKVRRDWKQVEIYQQFKETKKRRA
jgi:hypothetical protein